MFQGFFLLGGGGGANCFIQKYYNIITSVLKRFIDKKEFTEIIVVFVLIAYDLLCLYCYLNFSSQIYSYKFCN